MFNFRCRFAFDREGVALPPADGAHESSLDAALLWSAIFFVVSDELECERSCFTKSIFESIFPSQILQSSQSLSSVILK